MQKKCRTNNMVILIVTFTATIKSIRGLRVKLESDHALRTQDPFACHLECQRSLDITLRQSRTIYHGTTVAEFTGENKEFPDGPAFFAVDKDLPEIVAAYKAGENQDTYLHTYETVKDLKIREFEGPLSATACLLKLYKDPKVSKNCKKNAKKFKNAHRKLIHCSLTGGCRKAKCTEIEFAETLQRVMEMTSEDEELQVHIDGLRYKRDAMLAKAWRDMSEPGCPLSDQYDGYAMPVVPFGFSVGDIMKGDPNEYIIFKPADTLRRIDAEKIESTCGTM